MKSCHLAFFKAYSIFSLLLGRATVTDSEGTDVSVVWAARRQAAREEQPDCSSVRVTNGRCAQPINNSKWSVIRGRKTLEMILRDHREKTKPW